MNHAVHFFCPGRPDPATIERYEQALHPLGGHYIIWHAKAGASSVFVNLANYWRRAGRCLPELLAQHPTPAGAPTTVTLVAFSAGYGAIRELLRHPDDRAGVDAVVLLDALHSGIEPDGTPADAQLAGFVAYAKRAKANGNDALLWIGHTDVPTYGYASVAASAREVVRLAGGEGGQFQVHPYDLYGPTQAKREHGAALVEWGPGYLAEALLPHLSALALQRQEQLPWRDPALTIGQRAVAWSLAQRALGAIETSGPNAGPLIAEYHSGAKRRDPHGVDRPVGLRSGDWCASGLCFAERRCLLPGEAPVMPWRVSGVELQRDAAELKLWRPVELVRSGAWRPSEGDVALFVRPATADPRTEWRRHVARVSTAPAAGGTYRTIDANHGDRWAEVDRNLHDRALLGFVAYPHPEQRRLPAEVWEHVVKVSDDVLHGRYGLDYALEGLRPQELVA